jgi:2-polyprenyl-3-methyl-5-hydroxy-6-metoxy-1,4-benzoquinol methylase
VGYDTFLAEIYDYSPYFGKERHDKEYATDYYLNHLPEKDSGTVLEMVTCTGILTIPMARAGYKVDSIDASSEVQSIALEKLKKEDPYVSDNIAFRCSDVFKLKTDKKYSAIVMPDSFIHAVADETRQEKLIEKCYELLNDDGILIIDIFVPWKNVIEKKELNQCSRFRTKDGKLYIVYVHHIIDEERQLHTFEFVHELYETKTRYKHRVVYRYLYSEQLMEMLEKKGFVITDVNKTLNFGKCVAVSAIKKKNDTGPKMWNYP